MKEGLAPRAERLSNWDAESCDEVVYLTKTYGLHFAANARKNDSEDLVIIEIDTDLLPDQEKLLADEDALWFAWKAGVIKPNEVEEYIYDQPQEKQVQWFAGFLEDFSSLGCTWDWSLKTLGNCTYLGIIPPSAITRIVTYEAKTGWWVAFHDPQIAPSNFKFCGAEYEATQLVVAGRLDQAKNVKMMFPMVLGLDDIDEMCRAHRTGLQTFEATPALSV
ncbi:hypothetical protein [Rhizobium sp. MHM7A]|uniref:hypothetical protein n=1 Tax=Rhizobium sp. MHM7A TaxID=2583233 RepID=UPI00110669A9|nr:hypothetical protein [Rhizobium sp. MHM7A]TLX17119.1 hypothetical protein FFR93_07350 [Rhizobium sp. MHM7A]